ncbi:MAG: SUF system NifU family Fe-S cluster assembly protein [Candidatus Norongarragalinales archaeon]
MEMYSEAVLRYYEKPPNKSKMHDADTQGHLDNPLCGDEVTVYLKIKNGVVEKASFDGQGCAVSQASASMLLESLEGKKLSEVKKTGEKAVLKMLGGKISPARLKCAFLGLKALKNAVKEKA